MIVGLGVELDFALRDLDEVLFERKNQFNLEEYKSRFSSYISGGVDKEIERLIKEYSYIFLPYSNLDKILRNRRFNKEIKTENY